MATSKEFILEAVRRNRPETSPLPELNEAWTTYADPRAKFIEVLEAVGGKTILGRDAADVNEQLSQLPQYASAQKVVSLVPGVGTSNVDLTAIKSPHALANVDIAILPGEFGVAENAAVWATDRNVPLRVLYFLCQHLVLIVPADAIVDNMHAAYERIASRGRGRVSFPPDKLLPQESVSGENETRPPKPSAFEEPIFGVFISGPSKTADIEQSLVIGAHGPRSLTVCLREE